MHPLFLFYKFAFLNKLLYCLFLSVDKMLIMRGLLLVKDLFIDYDLIV